jgi:hypothetical protein
MLPSKREG